MALDGFIFDQRPITSAAWAHYNWVFSGKQDGITSGCDMTVSGNDVVVDSGYFLIRGRLGIVDSATTVGGPTISSGTVYAILVAQIDLTQTNTTSSMEQLKFVIKTDQSSYPTPVQQDLDAGGTTYEVQFAKFTISSAGIANFETTIGDIDLNWISASQLQYDSDSNSLYITM